VCDLKADPGRPNSATVATEFVGTSISSGGDGTDTMSMAGRLAVENPHVKFFNAQRGYVTCTVTPQQWVARYRVVPYVSKPGSPVRTRASFVVENGRPGAVPA
jgi:alkaline phosphatase D